MDICDLPVYIQLDQLNQLRDSFEQQSRRPQRLSNKGKTLFVLAHPDDETITGAGYLARLGFLAKFRSIDRLGSLWNKLSGKLPRQFALAKWVKPPVVYYATLGEKGNHNGVRTDEPLKVVRREELKKAAKILGIKTFVDRFSDGELQQIIWRLELRILAFLKRECPDRVITFAPSGLTGHADHKAIADATTRAVERYNQTAEKPIELYYRVIDPNEKGITGPFITYDPEYDITHTKSTSVFRKRILRAIEAHQTQVPEMGTIYTAFEKYAKKPQNPPRYKGETSKIWREETYCRVK